MQVKKIIIRAQKINFGENMRHGIKLSAIAMLTAGLLCSNVYAVEAPSTLDTAAIIKNNQAASAAFLAANKTKPGVVTLANGLQYKELTAGKGESPTDSDTVVVEYVGTLIDGTKFDSSYDRGQPATFPVAAVIPGWTQALKLMKPGATWELYIPAELAYGEQGVPGNPGQAPVIGPNQALVFKVHLVSVSKS